MHIDINQYTPRVIFCIGVDVIVQLHTFRANTFKRVFNPIRVV